MKFPPKFALFIIPVTLLHLVVITLFGVMMRMNESKHLVNHADHDHVGDIEVPSHIHSDPSITGHDGIESSLFPARKNSPPDYEPEPIDELGEQPIVSHFSVLQDEKARIPDERIDQPSIPHQDHEPVKAEATKPGVRKQPGIRGFRPIGVKKST